jgi:hypothetical protein
MGTSMLKYLIALMGLCVLVLAHGSDYASEYDGEYDSDRFVVDVEQVAELDRGNYDHVGPDQ